MRYTDNLFQSYNQKPDWITQSYIHLDYAPNTALNLYYTGGTNLFAEYDDLFSHSHRAGLSYVRPGEGRNALYAGVESTVRLDRPLYDYRDYLRGKAYLRAKIYLRPTLLFRTGYTLRSAEYVHARDYSFLEQSAFARISHFLPTRTTLEVRSELGAKTYIRAATDSIAGTALSRSNGGRTLMELVLRAKVAQSLTRYTGLQVEYLERMNLAGYSRYREEETYNPDDELFDDHYSYEGSTFRTTLKHLGFWGIL